MSGSSRQRYCLLLLYVNIFVYDKFHCSQFYRMVKARVQEAMRFAKNYNKKTYVYIRYVYIDTKNLLSAVRLIGIFEVGFKFDLFCDFISE